MSEYDYVCACCGKHWHSISTDRKPTVREIDRMVCQPCRCAASALEAAQRDHAASIVAWKREVEGRQSMVEAVQLARVRVAKDLETAYASRDRILAMVREMPCYCGQGAKGTICHQHRILRESEVAG